MKRILDACCGSRMFWFDKECQDAVFMDNRMLQTKLCDGRNLVIQPDIVADFRAIPFEDGSFYLVVFDPPHLLHAGKNSWLAKKYGLLGENWREDLKQGFCECMSRLEHLQVIQPYRREFFRITCRLSSHLYDISSLTFFFLQSIHIFNRLQNYFLPPHLKSPKNNPPFYLFVKYAQFSP